MRSEGGTEMARKLCFALLAALGALALNAGAQGTANGTAAQAAAPAATLTVDNDRKDCPNADYTGIRDAIDAASSGDTIVVCAGTYAEGPGTVGSTALPITKSLTIRGAGADKVTIEPKSAKDHRIAESNPDIRNGKGVVIIAKGDPSAPITVHISGVTVDANGVDATAGIVFLDAQGSVDRSLVTGLDVDESADGYTVPRRLPQQRVRHRHRRGDPGSASRERAAAADRAADDHDRPHAG
jgi:hypothetical protein